jgi:hypothetical protein
LSSLKVAEALTVQLTSPAISVTEARIVVGLLKRMHLEGKAKEVFLSGRTQHIVTGIKQLKTDSNRAHFVRSLSRLVFCAVRDTCADYLQCFGESANSISTLSVWCLKETHSYGQLWIRFVIDRGVGGEKTGEKCNMKIVFILFERGFVELGIVECVYGRSHFVRSFVGAIWNVFGQDAAKAAVASCGGKVRNVCKEHNRETRFGAAAKGRLVCNSARAPFSL